MDVDRRGTVAILAAMMLVFLMGMAAFAVDLAYLELVREQMQTAADAAALAASDELVGTWDADGTQVAAAVDAAHTVAEVTAMANRMSGKSGTFVDGARDLRFGSRSWDSDAGQYVETWGQPPYNLVEVTVRRTEASGRMDSRVPLFFARMLGREYASLQTTSVVALSSGAGLRIDENFAATLPILPIICDEQTWDAHWDWSSGQGNSNDDLADDYSFDSVNQEWAQQSDQVAEINIYPSQDSEMPPGNRGTVDIGPSNNSTQDLKRQIEFGVSTSDLAVLGGELVPPFELQGDPGISAGIKSALTSIVGQKRIMPIFSSVSGNGNNAEFIISKFVAVRIVSVKLTGRNKYLWVQRCSYSHPMVIRSTVESSEQPTLMSSGALLR